MANENLKIDENDRNVLGAITNDVNEFIKNCRVNPITGRLLVDAAVTSTNTSIGSTIPGGTAGSILFLGLGSTLAQDNANLFYDDTSNFVGLGNNTPSATLDLVGTFQYVDGSQANNYVLTSDALGNATWVDPTTLPGLSGYNRIQDNGSNLPQENTLNFVNYFTVTDNPGIATNVDIDVVGLANDVTFITTLTNNATFQTDVVNFINTSGSLQVNLATQVTGILPLVHGGTGSALADPNYDAIMGWDDTDNSVSFWHVGTGLLYDHPTHTLNVDTSGGAVQAGIQFDDETGTPMGTTGTVNEFEITGDFVVGARAGNKVTYTLTQTGKLAVDGADTTPDYLDPKLNIHSSDTSVNITKTITNPGGNEVLDYDLKVSTVGGFIAQQIALSDGTFTVDHIVMTSDQTGTVMYLAYVSSTSATTVNILRMLKDPVTGNYYITHSTTLTISTGGLKGIAVAGGFVYVVCVIAATSSMRRYSATDLSGVTTMTGLTAGDSRPMWSDGTDLFIQDSIADSFKRYTIAATVLTDTGAVGFTSAGTATGCISDGTNAWITDGSGTGTYNIRKYLITGGAVISTTSIPLALGAYTGLAADTSLFLGASNILALGWGYNMTSDSAVTGIAINLMGITLP